jgi:hypothetical protein
MAGNLTIRASSWTQMLSTELNSLAAGSGALQATGTNVAFDNTNSSNLFTRMRLEIDVTFGTAPTAGKTIDFYIVPLSQAGGTTYWDGAGGATPVAPGTQFIGSVPLRNVTTIQRLGIRNIPIGYEQFILNVVNSADQAFPATGTVVNIRAEADAYT